LVNNLKIIWFIKKISKSHAKIVRVITRDNDEILFFGKVL